MGHTRWNITLCQEIPEQETCGQVFNVTFNNILSISLWSVSLVVETGVPAKKTTNLSQVTDKLYQIMLCRAHHAMSGIITHEVTSCR
jgi:hypothetical protein